MMAQLSKFAPLLLIIGILVLVLSGNLLSSSPFVIIAQLCAIALSIAARRGFQAEQFNIHADPKPGPLLVSGPYRLIRHPMYAAALLLIWSSILGHLSLVTLLVGVIVTGTIATRITVEEQFLSAHFPAYIAYARKTKRIIPAIL